MDRSAIVPFGPPCLALLVLAPGWRPALRSADPRPDVRHYDLRVEVRDDGLRGTVAIEALPAPGGEWSLELAPAMEVSSVECTGEDVPFQRRGSALVLDLSSLGGAAEGEPLRLVIRVEGRPYNRFSEDRGGFVRTVVGADIAYIRSQYPWYPRAGNDAATYRIVVDAREDWLVRTAGREEGRETTDGRTAWTFVEDRPVLDVGLAAGPYERRELEAAGGLVVDALVFPGDEAGADHLLGIARRACDHYSGRFGKVDRNRFTLVEMPEEFGAHSGYSEAGYFLIGRGAFEAAAGGAGGEELVAHEAAHTWWGGEVAFTHFASESLACWAALGFLEEELGEDAARMERSRAVTAVVEAAARGAEVAFADITPWGSGMDPKTYRVHAYEKGMMVLAMVEDAVGRKSLDRILARFLDDRRGTLVGYADLRQALAKAGSGARTVLDQWEVPGIPLLSLEHQAKKSGSKWRVTGSLFQEGTAEPYRMKVGVVALCGEEAVENSVELDGRSAAFRLTTPTPPDAIVIDPGFRLLAGRTTAMDPDTVVGEAFQVVNTPADDDPDRCERTIRLLRGLLAAGAGEHEGLCHTGIGRCLFRLGRNEEAKAELEVALRLGGGGPFHRSWIQLRLGCIADLAGDRKAALEHYERARGKGASKTSAEMAARFSQEPYRGFDRDG